MVSFLPEESESVMVLFRIKSESNCLADGMASTLLSVELFRALDLRELRSFRLRPERLDLCERLLERFTEETFLRGVL